MSEEELININGIREDLYQAMQIGNITLNCKNSQELYDFMNYQDKEIERLNNIINETEKEIDRLLERQYESERFAKEQGFDTYLPAKENLLCVKNKLQELKGNDNNE